MVLYALPSAAAGYMLSLVGLYLMKYSTDVLLIAPATMGAIFGLSRIWDAVTDPLVGYLSDRTQFRLGRRRTWMLLGAVPCGISYCLLFALPVELDETGAALWMALAVFAFYTAMTTIMVPHLSWGAELSKDYYERNKIFGIRQVGSFVGGMLGLLTVGWFSSLEAQGTDQVRAIAPTVAIVAAVLMVAITLLSVFFLSEQSAVDKRPKNGLIRAMADVWKNQHARLLIIVSFIENIGMAALGAAALYVAQYVMHRIEIAPYSIITYLLTSALFIPLWIKLAKRHGKIRVWFWSMIGSAFSYGGLFFLVLIPQQGAQIVVLMFLSFTCGVFAACGATIGPSIQTDVIDYDELITGERKEGVYFAVWNFALKSASGVTLMITGFVLSAAGFEPNEEQTRTVQFAMCALLGLFPFTCYIAGALMFRNFELDESKHSEIRTALAARVNA